MRESDLGEGLLLAVIVNGWPVLLARYNGALFAGINSCPHANAPLSDGRLRRGAIICARHGAQFELNTGNCVGGAYAALRKFPTQTSDGWIEVQVPSEAPDPTVLPVQSD